MRIMGTTKRAIGSIARLAFIVCFVLGVTCFVPKLAWADDGEGIPRGVLVLCDNPFEVDCGCDGASSFASSHGVSMETDQNANDLTNETPSSNEARPSEAPVTLPGGSTGNGVESMPADEGCAQSASNVASSSGSSEGMTTESADDAFVIIEEEGVFPYEASTILIEVKAGISRSEFNELISSLGGVCVADVADEDLQYGLVKLRVAEGVSVYEALERAMRVDGVLNAQLNYVYQVDSVGVQTAVNDASASRQWGLDSADVYSAWDIARTRQSIAVAVIDTGADLDHPDLAGNIVATHNSFSAANTVEDIVGHGTHVAGIIAGVANNGIGIAGTSYNANLVVIKASPYKSSAFDTASIVRAYAWLESLDSSGLTVAQHYNVRVVNLSLGGHDGDLSANFRDDALINAMLKARDEYGILTVASAGNGASSSLPYFSYPGDSEACLSVMNLERVVDKDTGSVSYDLNYTSNYNVAGTTYKDICAPGTNILSTWIDGLYASNTGTSMAAPFVSGIAALMFAVNPALTPCMVMSMIEATATDLGVEGWDEKYGYGMINAYEAVKLANYSRIEGADVISTAGSAAYTVILGSGVEDGGIAYSWRILKGGEFARIDSNGILFGQAPGEVALIYSFITSSGAMVSVAKTVRVLASYITGDSIVQAGTSSLQYATVNPEFTWVWEVECVSGCARIDQDGTLVAESPGLINVIATCASNTDIVLRKKIAITA